MIFKQFLFGEPREVLRPGTAVGTQGLQLERRLLQETALALGERQRVRTAPDPLHEHFFRQFAELLLGNRCGDLLHTLCVVVAQDPPDPIMSCTSFARTAGIGGASPRGLSWCS